MKKFKLLLLIVVIGTTTFAQDDIKECGQLPHLNPTFKAICSTDIEKVLSADLSSSFLKEKLYTATFKLIIDCNGRIDMVIYKKGNLSAEQQKHFLYKLNDLKDWQAGKIDGSDVSTTVYFLIDISKKTVTFKQY